MIHKNKITNILLMLLTSYNAFAVSVEDCQAIDKTDEVAIKECWDQYTKERPQPLGNQQGGMQGDFGDQQGGMQGDFGDQQDGMQGDFGDQQDGTVMRSSGGLFGSGNTGASGNTSLGNRGISQKYEECILNETSKDIDALYTNTISTLENLSQGKNSCSFLTAQAGALASNMRNFENQLQPKLPKNSCYGIELQLKKSYQTILYRMSNNLDISNLVAMDFPDYCEDIAYRFPPYEYSDEDYACIANALAKTLEEKSVSCEIDDKLTEEAYSDQKKGEALQQVNSIMNSLISGTDGCNEEDVKKGVLSSVMNVGTAIAGMTYGTVGSAVGGFLSGIFSSVIKAKQKVATTDILESEKSFRNNACLFSAIQKRRCNEFDPKNLRIINCANINDPYNVLELNNFAMNIDRIFKEGGNAELLKLMGSRNFNGKNIIDFIDSDVLPFLDDNLEIELGEDIYNFKDNLKKYIDKIQEIQAIPRGEDFKEDRARLLSDIKKLKERISSNSFSDMLKKYETFLEKNADDYKKAYYHSKIQQMTRQFTRGMLTTGQTINDSKDISLMTTAFIKEMRPSFNSHLADNYNSNLQRAQANYYGNKEEAFNAMASTIAECIMTQGIYIMKDVEFDEGSSTSSFEKSPFGNYPQVCEQFACEMGMPEYKDKTSTPEEYRAHQCLNLNSPEQILAKMKAKFLKSGSFCSKGVLQMKKIKSKSK